MDQKVAGSSKLYNEGVDQLDRDVLRFLELVPDVPMAKVTIATNVAFPLAQMTSDRALTKDDFVASNAKHLLEKLGVPEDCLQVPRETVPEKIQNMYTRVVCRYLGAHAQVQARVPIEKGLDVLDLAVKGTDGGFTAEALNLPSRPVEVNMKAVVASDDRMREIRSAVQTPKCWKVFARANPNIPLADLKQDKERFLKQKSTNSYPLYGAPVINALLDALDEKVSQHQGPDDIIDFLSKKKYLLFDENGISMDMKTVVAEHIRDCIDCSEVERLKKGILHCGNETHVEVHADFELQSVPSFIPTPVAIPEKVEAEVLEYADRRHQGFAEAYKRIKSWTVFSDMKRKVYQ